MTEIRMRIPVGIKPFSTLEGEGEPEMTLDLSEAQARELLGTLKRLFGEPTPPQYAPNPLFGAPLPQTPYPGYKPGDVWCADHAAGVASGPERGSWRDGVR